jgi:PadR family transcriptional regulator PadR
VKKNRVILKNELKKTILDLFRNKDMYGYEVTKILGINGEKIEAPRIYTILKELNDEGLLLDRWERSTTGPRRRIYSLSEKGREDVKEHMLEAITVVHKHYGDYLISLYPKVDVLGDILNQLLMGMEGKKNIGYFTSKNYGMTKIIISRLQRMMPEGNVFLIKPRSVEINPEIENVDILSGRYEDISLKDGFADILIIVDLPGKERIGPTIKEWHRVLSPKGSLGILIPSVLIKKREDPISLGDFVEKHEHEILGQSNYIDGEFLKKELSDYFDEVEDKTIVHMSFIAAKQPVQLS